MKRGPKKTNRGTFKKGVHKSPATEFKKGHIPWNKGLKGLRLSPATTFKNGHLPWNTKYDGCIVVRLNRVKNTKYKYIRISKGIWKEYHRYLWERERGLIPQGYILRFRNGNTLDCRIENLELITRAENGRRNHNRKKAAESMKMIWALKYFSSDRYIAFTLAPLDERIQRKILKKPELIKQQRENLKNKHVRNITIIRPPNKEEVKELLMRARESDNKRALVYEEC